MTGCVSLCMGHVEYEENSSRFLSKILIASHSTSMSLSFSKRRGSSRSTKNQKCCLHTEHDPYYYLGRKAKFYLWEHWKHNARFFRVNGPWSNICFHHETTSFCLTARFVYSPMPLQPKAANRVMCFTCWSGLVFAQVELFTLKVLTLSAQLVLRERLTLILASISMFPVVSSKVNCNQWGCTAWTGNVRTVLYQ